MLHSREFIDRAQSSMFLNAHSGITETKGSGLVMETSKRDGINLKSDFAKSSQGRVHSR